MLRAQALSAVRGGDTLFQNVSLTVRPGDRIALVGPNGAGKTTLLRFLSGEQDPEAGKVLRDENDTLIALAQEERAGNGLVWEEVTSGIGPILELEQEIEATTTYWECFRGANLRRTEISVMVYLIQVIGGNPLIGYANFFFEQAGLDASDAFNSENLLTTAFEWWNTNV